MELIWGPTCVFTIANCSWMPTRPLTEDWHLIWYFYTQVLRIWQLPIGMLLFVMCHAVPCQCFPSIMFHNFSRPSQFSFAVRRTEQHGPEGTVSIEEESYGETGVAMNLWCWQIFFNDWKFWQVHRCIHLSSPWKTMAVLQLSLVCSNHCICTELALGTWAGQPDIKLLDKESS